MYLFNNILVKIESLDKNFNIWYTLSNGSKYVTDSQLEKQPEKPDYKTPRKCSVYKRKENHRRSNFKKCLI